MNSIHIRNATLEDAGQILKIYTYYVENTAITFEYDTPSLTAFKTRMRNTMKRYPYLVIEQEGKILGYAYAGPFKERAAYDWACELTIYMDCTVQRNGLGRKLYEALEVALKEMGMVNLYACIGYPEVEDKYLTKNSAEFHAHLGFTEVGKFHQCGYKFGNWYHMIWMEKMVGEHQIDPKPITPHDSVSKT